MSNIQVGDLVKVANQASFDMLERWSKRNSLDIFKDIEQLHEVTGVCDRGYIRVGDMSANEGWSAHRFVKVTPKAVSPERTAEINNALGIPSPFVKARQEAWDRFLASRRKANQYLPFPDGLVRTTHDAAFEAGVLHGIKQAQAQQAAQTTIALARHSDPATSKAAAKRVKGVTLESLVLKALEFRNMTGKEIAVHTGVPLNSVTPRLAPLRRKGLIYAYAGRGGETVWKIGNGIFTSPETQATTG